MSAAARIAQIRDEMRSLSDRLSAETREADGNESVRMRDLLSEAAALGDPTATRGVLRLSEIEAGELDERETALLVSDAASWALATGADGIADAIVALTSAERDAMLSALVLLWQGLLDSEGGEHGREFLARSLDLSRRQSGDVVS